jgi:pimeloyl-ACP methyl ester carboxylesterase
MDVATDYVTSRDGTTIGYRTLGHGPGVVLLHGSMSTGYNHIQLAEALADAFTVYLPDRRGRGLSRPYRHDYTLREDVDDLDALLVRTGAHNVFGNSVGGIVVLQAALTLPAVHKAAVYEPPFFSDSSVPTTFTTRFDIEMSQGKVAAALVTAMKGAQLGPPIFNVMPRWLLKSMTSRMMAYEEKTGSADYTTFRELAPTLHHDAQLIIGMSKGLENLRSMHPDVLLLGGSKSPRYLTAGLHALETVLPHVKRVEFPRLGHAAAWNTDKGGKPEPVARELRQFFAQRADDESLAEMEDRPATSDPT